MSEAGARKWIITITVILASVIELVDTSIVNVALPADDGQPGRHARRGRLGRDRLRRGERDRRADGRLALVRLRTPQLLRRLDHPLHGRVLLLRTRHGHLGARGLPVHPGRRRRRAAGDLTVDPGRDVPARGARPRQRPLRTRRRRRPDDRPDPRRLDHRQLLVAVDLLRQPADRPRRHAPDVLLHPRPQGKAPRRPRRLAGHRAAGRRDRIAADRPRTRRARRLVLGGLHRGPDHRGGSRHHRVHRPRADRRASHRGPARPERPIARRRNALHVHHGVRALRVGLHLPRFRAGPARFHGHADRPDPPARKPRHGGDDADRGQAHAEEACLRSS